MKKYRHWSQHSFGYLTNGWRVMLVNIETDNHSRREFPAVLVCRPDGLYRLWRNGRSRLIGPGYVWPGATKSKWEAVRTLSPFVPEAWGVQRDSKGAFRPIPDRILQARTDNLARLLIAWYFTERSAFSDRVQRFNLGPRPQAPLPPAPLWHPVAITVVPNTDLVVRALHTGILLQRLKRGLERIYVSEMAWVRAPRVEVTLRALAFRFPQRLVLVKAEGYKSLARILRANRVRAAEYQFIGSQLQERYEDDFGYDKFDHRSALDGMARLRVGDIPRGSRMLWMHEIAFDFDLWAGLDVDGITELENQADKRRAIQDQRAVAALTLTLQSTTAEKSHGIQDENVPVGKPSTAVVADCGFMKSIEDLPE